ncbi:hypothetical protein ACP4OV_001761 [Aristida adscensionis]
MALHCATPAVSASARPRLPSRHHGALPHPPPAPAPAVAPPITRGPRRLRLAGAGAVCRVRRRVRYEEEDEEEREEEWGHNEDVARLERYSEGARDQALLVKARVDDELEVVLVFRGFSSSLSGSTAADLSRSVLPERAIIQSVDVVRGPFDPNNIEYMEKDVAWNDFKSRLQ